MTIFETMGLAWTIFSTALVTIAAGGMILIGSLRVLVAIAAEIWASARRLKARIFDEAEV